MARDEDVTFSTGPNPGVWGSSTILVEGACTQLLANRNVTLQGLGQAYAPHSKESRGHKHRASACLPNALFRFWKRECE